MHKSLSPSRLASHSSSILKGIKASSRPLVFKFYSAIPLQNIYDPEDASKAHISITLDEFESAFLACWKPTKVLYPRSSASLAVLARARIAIAVSGGADSMALAYLCKKLQDKRPYDFDFRAIVINHNARAGSLEEAEDVMDMLAYLGLPTVVKSVVWPEDQNPLKMSNFETKARTARFKSIGIWCNETHARSVLLGHHQDDQAETVLSRILSGHSGAGYSGIKQSGAIPACHGIFGASEGPAREMFYIGLKGKLPEHWIMLTRPRRRSHIASLAAAGDGITLHRPLLGFSKTRLRATCRKAGITWKEDKTNQDVTLTPRNAIRSLLASDRLPQALRKRSILQLAGKVAKRSANIEEAVNLAFNSLKHIRFDPRSGVLHVRLTESDLLGDCPVDPIRAMLVAIGVVTRLARLITAAVEPKDAEAITSKLLDVLRFSDAEKSFTGAGAVWELMQESVGPVFRIRRQLYARYQEPICAWAHKSLLEPESHAHEILRIVDSSMIGLEHHQGHGKVIDHKAKQVDFEKQFPRLSTINEFVPTKGQDPLARNRRTVRFKRFGAWHLFDDRFWIRVWSLENQLILVRPLKPSDVGCFRKGHTKKTLKILKDVLNTVAPNLTRFTLPVLTNQHGHPLAIPTLGYVTPEADPELRWDWMYKHIAPMCFHEHLSWYRKDFETHEAESFAMEPEPEPDEIDDYEASERADRHTMKQLAKQSQSKLP